jgi:hypothetical protein
VTGYVTGYGRAAQRSGSQDAARQTRSVGRSARISVANDMNACREESQERAEACTLQYTQAR